MYPSHAPHMLPAGGTTHQREIVQLIFDKGISLVATLGAGNETHCVIDRMRAFELKMDDVAHDLRLSAVVAGTAGIEPATTWLTAKRSTN